MIDTTVKALKNLCAVIKGDGTKAEDIPGETIVDVINQIAIAKGGDDPSGELGTLTLTSVPGEDTGTTKITVTGASSTNFRYKTGAGIAAPTYHEDLSDWTTWNGTDDITADDGSTMHVAEVDSSNLAIAYGFVTVNAKL